MTRAHQAPEKAEAGCPSSRRLGAAVIASSDRPGGLLIAARLAEAGVPVVLHSDQPSETISDALHEIVTSGGQAIALESDLSDPADPEGLLAAAAQYVGPISAVIVLAPPHCHGSRNLSAPDRRAPDRRAPDRRGDAGELESARQAVRWSRAVISALAAPCRGIVVGVLPVHRPSEPAGAVERGAFEGAMSGLRTELGRLGAQVHTVIAAGSDPATRQGRDARSPAPDARSTVQIVTELVLERLASAIGPARNHDSLEQVGHQPSSTGQRPASSAARSL